MTLDTILLNVSSVYIKGVKVSNPIHDIALLNNFFHKHATVFVLWYLIKYYYNIINGNKPHYTAIGLCLIYPPSPWSI